MTFPLALIFFALLMIYCGVKGTSLKAALLGHSVPASSGSLLGGLPGSVSGSGSTGPTTPVLGAPASVSGSLIPPVAPSTGVGPAGLNPPGTSIIAPTTGG